MNTPVLLLVYNRSEQTLRVLQRLKELGATNVFVSGDGPKNSADRERTKEVKSNIHRFTSIVSNSRFSDRNGGCKKAVIGGINWFFDQVDEGIILEDDCLPSEHFFPFMNDMLNRYRDAEKVWMISGNNPLGSWESEGGHFFSRIGHIWGWATWRNRWDDFRPELPYIQSFIDDSGFEKAFAPTKLAENRKQLTLQSKRGEIDTWDYQWMVQILTENGLAVVPSQNLVENIGFTDEGTNLMSKPNWIVNETCNQPIQILEHEIAIDREYEMELSLAKRANRKPNSSSTNFLRKGDSTTRKLKILTINSTEIGGGAEKLALMLHTALLNLGHAATMLVETKKSTVESVVECHGDWKKHIESLAPDVIHIHNLHGTSFSLNDLSAVSKRTPTLLTLHDTWLLTGSTTHAFEPDPAKLSLLDLLEWNKTFQVRKQAVSEGNIRFTAPSQWMRERFFGRHGIRPFYVPNTAEEVARTSVEIPSERYILFVANRPKTNPYKDFETLEKGWKKANELLGTNGCDLICLGGHPSVSSFGSHSLFILERKTPEEVRAFIEKSLLVVQVSQQDNAPLAVLEAHLYGRMVVATLDGGIPELLCEEECHWLHEPKNADDLAAKIVNALSNEVNFVAPPHPTIETVVNMYLGHYVSLIVKEKEK